MRKSLLLPGIAAALAAGLLMSPALSAQNLVHDRIPALSSKSGRISLSETVIPRAKRAVDHGLASASTPIRAMSLRFSVSDAQNLALSQLEIAQQNPSSAMYHQWLTPETYAAQFGLSDDDLAKVTGWLAAQGFTGIEVARSRSFVTFSGTAAQVANAFGTPLHTVTEDGETHFANLNEPTLPAAFSGTVTGLTGLNDFRMRPHVHAHQVAAPDFTSSISGSTFIAPGDFYTIYDINPLLNASINGTGITIGVMGQTDIALSDIAAFRSASGLAANVPTVKLYGTDPGTSSSDLPEASLDVEWSGAVAPSATILYVNSTDVISGSLTQAVDNNLAPILTISYGDCESGFGSSNIAVYNQLFRQATLQGQTILGPAGDSGATDCDYQSASATNGLAVDFPASSPYVTGVGGTMFNEGGGTYFSTTNGNYQGSALSYIPEAVWNESATAGSLAAGGGGISAYFTKPSYQVGTGVPNDFSRDVPDVAFNAAASHDGYLFCSGGFCTNGFRNATNNLDVVGGTSVSTPSYAGIMALLQQKIKARVGNANPVIYGLANSTYYSTVFHDVTVGNNNSPCTAGSTNCASGGSIGFAATTGFDLATGWGSLDATNMVNDWLLATPTGLSSSTGVNTSAVTLVESASTVTAGTAVTLTATVKSSTNGLTATPSGTAQLLIDTVASGNSVALVNGVATFAVSTTSLTSGNHILGVAYSGDATFTGSKGAVNLDIISATAPDFNLTPVTTTITVASGQTAAGQTFTVTPLNGFSGPVSFSASTSSSSLTATYSFSVSPVTISGTTGASTVLTLEAFQSQGVFGVGEGRFGAARIASNHNRTAPWQAAGSGVALAGFLCLLLPGVRRRRSFGLFAAALLSIGMLATVGCSETPNGTTPTTSSSTINTTPGTYTITVSATGTATGTTTTVTHNSTVTFVVQ